MVSSRPLFRVLLLFLVHLAGLLTWLPVFCVDVAPNPRILCTRICECSTATVCVVSHVFCFFLFSEFISGQDALHTVLNSLYMHTLPKSSKKDSFSWGHDPCTLACKARPSFDGCGTSLSVSFSSLSTSRTLLDDDERKNMTRKTFEISAKVVRITLGHCGLYGRQRSQKNGGCPNGEQRLCASTFRVAVFLLFFFVSSCCQILPLEGKVKYLEQVITFVEQETTEVQHRIRCAWSAFDRHRQKLTSQSYLLLRHRLHLIDAVVTPTMSYGARTWATTKDREKCSAIPSAECFARQKDNTKKELGEKDIRDDEVSEDTQEEYSTQQYIT